MSDDRGVCVKCGVVVGHNESCIVRADGSVYHVACYIETVEAEVV